jgi:hypothetical protein
MAPPRSLPLLLAAAAAVCLGLSACGGGSSDAPSGTSGSSSVNTESASSSGASSSSSSSSSSGNSSSSSSGSSSSSSGSASAVGSSAAAALASKLGKPNRLLIGLGSQSGSGLAAAVLSQNLKPDIDDKYLGGVGAGDWTTYNSPPGAYIGIVAAEAASLGAVPMFTLYQMAENGGGNLSGLNDSTFMSAYWANVKLMFQDIAAIGKPTLVNFEPDFWGYVQQQATNGDPTKMFVYVNTNPDCATLSNDVVGVAGCLMAMGHKYAPNAYLGFPPSTWGAPSAAAVIAFMNTIGAQKADFIVWGTLDRDAGCYEADAVASGCNPQTPEVWYLDETNTTTPNYSQELAAAQSFHAGIGGLPLIWWQTPLGVPSSTPGGTPNHYRDNHVHYYLTHPSELTAIGGLAVVYGTGNDFQTSVYTDGGQFQSLDAAYLAAPVPLP